MDKSVESVRKIAAEADQWKNFADFCRLEMAVGGPDPHMKLTAAMCNLDSCPWSEKAWRGLCYLGVYNVPTAEQIWNAWHFERSIIEREEFLPWFTKHWQGIALRRERKSARSPIKMAKYFETASAWLSEALLDKKEGIGWIGGMKDLSPFDRYEFAWENVQQIYSMGRYIAFKYLQYGMQYLDFPINLQDIRAKGGWSPRAMLAILWPDQAVPILGGDSPEEIAVVDTYAAKTKAYLLEGYGVDLSWYNLQVLLCDYKQCYVGKRQFPGRSQDSEIAYAKKIEDYWGGDTIMWEARSMIFPHQALGEMNGWYSVREELGKVLYDHGYMWSDLIYDYNLSKTRLATPVKHGEKPGKSQKTLAWESGFGRFFKK
jgi:hypothetical protein